MEPSLIKENKQLKNQLKEKDSLLLKLQKQLLAAKTKLPVASLSKSRKIKGDFESLTDAYILLDLDRNILNVNAATLSVLGRKTWNKTLSLIDVILPSEKEKLEEVFKTLLQKELVSNFKIKIQAKDKKIKLIQINANLIKDTHGNPIAFQAVGRDITKEAQRIELLIASENRLITLIQNLDSGVLLEDENRNILQTNSQFCKLFGIVAPPEALIGNNCANAAEESKSFFKNPEAFVRAINTILENKKMVIGDVLKTVTGVVLERDYIPIFKNKLYNGHLWVYKDITQYHQYHKELERQKNKYRSIIDNMNLGLLEVSKENTILIMNRRFLEMSGYSEKELVGKNAIDLFFPKQNTRKFDEVLKRRAAGKSDSYELKSITKKGNTIYSLVSGAPNYDENGVLIGAIGIHLDITKQKKLEIEKGLLLKKLAVSNKELEEYAHVVSHDLKSPLRNIYALLFWLKEDNIKELSLTGIKYIKDIESILEKMHQLIDDVLKYSSVLALDSYEIKPSCLQEVLENVLKLLHIPPHITIIIKGSMPKINGDKTKLQQLFQNLLSNAIKYNDKEIGQIEIEVTEHLTYYEFSIKDNGQGIAKKDFKKIFNLFHFLEKREDSTGLGLAIVKKIVAFHGGKVWLKSILKKGTTFYFTLKK